MASGSNLKNQDDVGQHLERLRADFITLSETVARLASESTAGAQSHLRDTAAKAAHMVGAASEDVRQDAAKLSHDAIDTAQSVAGKLEAQIARNPMSAVLAALGAGFVIGLLSRRQ